MKVIIVAAGSGRRLMPLTKELPKCMVRVGGKRIIDFSLDNLRKAGLNDIVMVVGHKREKIKSYLGNKVKYVVNPDYARTNSMYSLWLARKHFGREFLYLHSDIIYEQSILKKILSCKNDACLSVDEKIVDEEDMKARIVNGLIREVNKVIPFKESRGEFIGIAKFKAKGISCLKKAMAALLKDKNNHNSYFECSVEHMIRNGHKVYPSLTRGKYYAEIDCKKNIVKADKDLKAKGGRL